jgi:hypothetical protein
MKKVKILGVGNQGKFNYLILEKNNDFLKWLSAILLTGLGINDDVMYYEYVNKSKRIRRKKNIMRMIDEHESYQDEKSMVEVFYGKNKVFMSIYTSLENRKKLMDELYHLSVWKKPSK